MSLQEAFITYFNDREAAINGQGETSWHQRRRAALSDFEKLGFPSKKNEEYKYTPIGRALEREFSEVNLANTSFNTDLVQELLASVIPADVQANQLVFVNGEYQPSLSKVISSLEEVTIVPLSEAYQKHGQVIDQYFSQQPSFHPDSFAALNTSIA
ncbi:MAG: hypothetical protein ACFB15_25580, partial [Cyclobacteriaceae bacterium]